MARNGAMSASQPSQPPPTEFTRRAMMRNRCGRLTRKTPTANRPVGPTPRVIVARRVPTAAGSRRELAMARSKLAHVSITPRATSGSGRTPLLYGSQKARNMRAAVQWATRRPSMAAPNRGRISRDRMNQTMKPAMSAGRRIHSDAVDTLVISASRS